MAENEAAVLRVTYMKSASATHTIRKRPFAPSA